ncbi:hypothetical protein MKX03_016672 [Papaver bracteatum]|nr:hypothetical protein MKX03_016672 [Papaver bracteatum]
MSKLSFLVLGSASTIFFALFTLSLFCMQSVDGSTIWSKKTVTVKNDIDPKIVLKIHCRSSEDDLGEHTLYYKEFFLWKFNVNVLMTTTFSCDLSWHDPNKKKDQIVKFIAYKARRDWKVHCLHDCSWSIRQDGGYYGDGYPAAVSLHPFEKMFSY